MAKGGESYEEVRKKKLEENKRKLEELKLGHLSVALRQATSPKPSPTKAVKRKAQEIESVPIRRSVRVASLPERPKYQEVGLDIVRKIRRSKSTRRDLANRVYATDEEREYTIEKATELEESLGSEFPTFTKPMLQSHVTGGFWLGLPTGFCRKNLPKKDKTITLIDQVNDEFDTVFRRVSAEKTFRKQDETITLTDEEDSEFDTVYLANKQGLSGEWRGFSLAHDLVDYFLRLLGLPTGFCRKNLPKKDETITLIDEEGTEFDTGLPTVFCRNNLPKKDETITLIDEENDEFDTVYLANKQGLSGGWRGFSLAHELVDGDALVFQLVSRTSFKVYIIRASGYHDQSMSCKLLKVT